MAVSVIGVVGICITIILCSLIGYLFYILYKEREEPQNKDILLNGLSRYTDGFGLGLIDNSESNGEETKIILHPRDYDPVKLKIEKTKVEPKPVYVRNDLLVPFPVSKHKNISIALPERGEQLPEEFKRHPFGRMVAQYIEERNSEKETIDIHRMRIKNQKRMLDKTEGLSILDDAITLQKEVTKSILEQAKQPQKQDEVK